MINIDLNQFGQIHWLSPLGKFDNSAIRKKHRDAYWAKRKLDINEFGEANWVGHADPEYVRLQNRKEWQATQKAKRAETDKRYGLDAGFDPNQPRDKEGQWTSGKVLQLGSKMRTVEMHGVKPQGDALEFTLDLYKTLEPNPLNDREVYKDFDGVLAFFEFGRPIASNLVDFKHIRTYPKRKGGGTKALKWLMDEARKANVGLRLDVDRRSDTPHRVLYKLYSKLGFVGENGPKDKDSMVWWPEN